MPDDTAFINALVAALQRQIAVLSGQLAQEEARGKVLTDKLKDLESSVNSEEVE